MKKLLACCLLCTLLLSFPAAAQNYTDVPQTEWYYPYVSGLSGKGIVHGYEDGTFRPGGTVTWGEALKLILLAAGQQEQPANELHWAGGYLNLCLQSGYLPVGPQYDLDAPITRQQVAQVAARVLQLRASMEENPFADCADPEVLALYEAGIVEGMEVNGQTCFVGEGRLLRSQISAIIWRMERYGGQAPPEIVLPEAPGQDTPEPGDGLLSPGDEAAAPGDNAPQPPAEVPGEAPSDPPSESSGGQQPVEEPPKQITYNTYTVDVLEDVPVFAHDPSSFFLENGRMYCSNPDVTLAHGIDVSSHQGLIDWQKVAGDGISFAILRAAYRGYTVGSLNKDTTFDFNAYQASRAGLQVGAYIFSQAITVEEALEEAEFLLDILKGKEITGPVVFDWEVIGTKNARTYGLDTDTLCAAANAFCERIAQAGYTPMIYFNSYAGYVKYDLSRVLDYDFWFAQYKEQPDFYYDFRMWQYTSSGKVEGVTGNVDLDVWFLPNG